MKKKKDWKNKIAEWFKDADWSVVFGIFCSALILGIALGIPAIQSCVNKDKPKDEQLRTEEFTYKGHKYIKFKGHDLLSTGSVVHDPDCECQIKRDSI